MLKSSTGQEDEIEYAIVMVYGHGNNSSLLLHGVGLAIEFDQEEVGLGRDEAGPTLIAPKELGLWVWAGVPTWKHVGVQDSSGEWDESAEPNYEGGTWRRPTPEEVTLLTNGNLEALFGPSRWPPNEEDSL
jgi:hypothetical protein